MGATIEFGIHNGRIIHITDVEKNGIQCDCRCPVCDKPLIAKLGKGGKIPHFAHDKDSECDPFHAQQTGLHLFAKEVIKESRSILAPGLTIGRGDVIDKSYDWKIAAETDIALPDTTAKTVHYDSVEIEKAVGDIVADAVISKNGKPCIIEIAVTHFVDEQKREKIERLNLPMFEIDLSPLLDGEPTKEEVVAAVLSDRNNRTWIFNPKREHILAEKKEEFRKKYTEVKSRKEAKEQRKIEYREQSINTLKQLMQPEYYAKETEKLRSDRQASFWLKRFDFGLTEYPFYMDIPISGEFVFSCDRRVWQGKLFEDYVIKGFGKEVLPFNINGIRKRIFQNRMIIHFDRQKVYRTTVFINGEEKEISLSYQVIEQYFYYLRILGFVLQSGYSWYSKRPTSLEPPKSVIAEILKDILRSVDGLRPDIDSVIKQELLARVPETMIREVQ